MHFIWRHNIWNSLAYLLTLWNAKHSPLSDVIKELLFSVSLSCPLAPIPNVPWFSSETLALYKLTYLLTYVCVRWRQRGRWIASGRRCIHWRCDVMTLVTSRESPSRRSRSTLSTWMTTHRSSRHRSTAELSSRTTTSALPCCRRVDHDFFPRCDCLHGHTHADTRQNMENSASRLLQKYA